REHRIAVELTVERRRVDARGGRALAGRISIGGRGGRRGRERAPDDIAGDARAAPVTCAVPADVHGAVDRRRGRHAGRSGGRRGVVDDRHPRGGDAERRVAGVGRDDLVRVGAVRQARLEVREGGGAGGG